MSEVRTARDADFCAIVCGIMRARGLNEVRARNDKEGNRNTYLLHSAGL
jgi:hypothetical protein